MDEARPISVEGSAVDSDSTRQPAVPDYDLLRKIGGGAYGEVWLARSKATGALRAAKIVWRHRFEDERPFQREFEGIQKFEQISREHPSQLALFHIGRNDPAGYFYYVMELADDAGNPKSETRNPKEIRNPNVEGSREREEGPGENYVPHTLRADLANGRLPAARVLEIGSALAEALGHLHQHGLVHRDVKPSNVIFVNGRPKLADIGLVTDASDRCSIVGTEGYLPPEGPGTPQADIFALGKVLYEASTGMDRRRFPDLPADMKEWPKPEAKLALELNEIVVKACAEHSGQRYRTADAMREELALLGKGASIRQKRARQQYWAAVRKGGVVLAVLGLIAASSAIFLRGPALPASNPDGPVSTNDLAQQSCDRAMAIIRNDDYDHFLDAYRGLTNAIFMDPNFARPHALLLEMAVRDFMPGRKRNPQEERQELAKQLRRLGNVAAANVAESMNSFFDWHFEAAEDHALKAIAASPNYEMAHTVYAFMLTCWGRSDEALLHLEKSLNLRRTKAIVHRGIGDAYYGKRDYAKALESYNKANELEPGQPRIFLARGRALWANKEYEKAVDDFEEADRLAAADESARASVTNRYARLRGALRDNGERGYWEQFAKDVEHTPNLPLRALVLIHIPDRKDDALRLLRDAADSGEFRGKENGLSYLLFADAWDGVRGDPRFTEVLEIIGFPKVMHPRKK